MYDTACLSYLSLTTMHHTLRLLHFADLHLDSAFSVDDLTTDSGIWRRADLRATLGRILTTARERRVDAVTIGGDLYDQDYALPDTGEFLAQQFARLTPMRVFVAPGEHDPYTTRSLYALTRWPSNVHIFTQSQLTPVQLTSDVQLWSAAHPAPQDNRAVERVRVNQPGINLLLLHAAERDDATSGAEAHFVVDASSVHNAGFDFALLGHRHTAWVWPDEAPRCVYPGSPEPLCWDESGGGHSVVLLTVDESQVHPEQTPIAQWRYWITEVDLAECAGPDEVNQRIQRSLSAAPGGPDERLICRVILTGVPSFDLDCDAIASALETKAHTQLKARLALRHDLDQLAAEQTVRGLLVRRFQTQLAEARDPEDRRAILKALALALDALDGRQVRPYEVA